MHPARIACGIAAAFALACLSGCGDKRPGTGPPPDNSVPINQIRNPRVIHVLAVLCDAKNPNVKGVSAELGNGRDPATNLYWGAEGGVKARFGKSPQWQAVKVTSPPRRRSILDQALFRRGNVFIVAEAYAADGMLEALQDFFRAAAGRADDRFTVAGDSGEAVEVLAGQWSSLVCFVGHNGLMDVQLDRLPKGAEGPKPEGAVVLAPRSWRDFVPKLRQVGCRPYVTVAPEAAPEAAALEAAVRTWADGGNKEDMHAAAAEAYAQVHRDVSVGSAKRVFVVGGAGL